MQIIRLHNCENMNNQSFQIETFFFFIQKLTSIIQSAFRLDTPVFQVRNVHLLRPLLVPRSALIVSCTAPAPVLLVLWPDPLQHQLLVFPALLLAHTRL